MSDVVLRCPACAATQSTPGQCAACRASDVRWYCPNHSPGRWLDGPACGECGARAAAPPSPAEQAAREKLRRERVGRPTPPSWKIPRSVPPLDEGAPGGGPGLAASGPIRRPRLLALAVTVAVLLALATCLVRRDSSRVDDPARGESGRAATRP